MHRASSEGDVTRKKSRKVSSAASASASASSSRPEISAPILLATTFNPNDAEAHKAVPVLTPEEEEDIDEEDIDVGTSKSKLGGSGILKKSSSASKVFGVGVDSAKVPSSLKELKRLSSSLLSGLSSSTSRLGVSAASNRSSFYVAEAVYEEAEAAAVNEHIYEEIPEKEEDEDNSNKQRPLPPIPEDGGNNSSASADQSHNNNPFFPNSRRGGSFFGGASRSEILSYLRSARYYSINARPPLYDCIFHNSLFVFAK